MKGTLLSAEDWHYLLRMKSLDDVMRYLGGTTYASAISNLGGASHDAGTVVSVLYGELFRDYRRLMGSLPTRGSELLRGLLSRYEAENLKTILRGLWQGRSSSEIRMVLYEMGALSRLPVEAILRLRDVTAAVEILHPTHFHTALVHALPQFHQQGSLFPLEMAIDRATFDYIRESLKDVRGIDQRWAKVLLDEMIDGVNLSWLVRFRHFYGLSPEEAINCTLRGGHLLNLRDLGRLARAADLPTFIELLPLPYREVLRYAERWEQMRTLFEKRYIGELLRAFRKDPFQVGLPMSYLLLKEIEVKSLESLLSALQMKATAESLIEWISLPVEGGMRV